MVFKRLIFSINLRYNFSLLILDLILDILKISKNNFLTLQKYRYVLYGEFLGS